MRGGHGQFNTYCSDDRACEPGQTYWAQRGKAPKPIAERLESIVGGHNYVHKLNTIYRIQHGLGKQSIFWKGLIIEVWMDNYNEFDREKVNGSHSWTVRVPKSAHWSNCAINWVELNTSPEISGRYVPMDPTWIKCFEIIGKIRLGKIHRTLAQPQTRGGELDQKPSLGRSRFPQYWELLKYWRVKFGTNHDTYATPDPICQSDAERTTASVAEENEVHICAAVCGEPTHHEIRAHHILWTKPDNHRVN